jgi:farnesyl diphosphate synthase
MMKMTQNKDKICLKLQMEQCAKAIEAQLEIVLAADKSRLSSAMRYAVLSGGKRIRPFLVLETARLMGGVAATPLVYQAACAIELIHCYSLVHDDLPSMDNDDLRRGQPTLHKAYDEATAILAGDALLTLAFETLTAPIENAALQLSLVQELAKASGIAGMVQGQMLDLAAEGRFDTAHAALNEQAIIHLQSLKTGALITCSVRMGAMIGGANAAQLLALDEYADNLGLAFQIADDLIDYEGDAKVAGKATAKDAGKGKATFVSLLGVEGARKTLSETIKVSISSIASFGDKAQILIDLAQHMAARKF